MKSALAPEPAFQAYELRLGPAVICRYLTVSSPCYRAGAAGVLRRHGVEKTTPPLGLVLQLTAQFEPVGLPSQHGLNIFGPWGSVKNSIVAGIRVSAWHVHLVFITKHRYRVLDGDAVDRLRLLFSNVHRLRIPTDGDGWGRPSCPPSGPLSTEAGESGSTYPLVFNFPSMW